MYLSERPATVGRAAAELGRAGGDRVLDQVDDDLVLAVGGHRADLGLPLDRVAEPQLLRLAGDALDEAVGDLAHHVDALDPRAGLAGVGEAAPDGAGDRVVEVGVGADDHRVLAAELEHRALQPLGADLADLAADLDRAGEEDLAGAGLGQRVADRAAAVDDADQALGQAALLEDAADRLAQQRRQAGRLEDDAVAGHQRDRHLAEGDRPGVVPGCDHADHADRLVGEAGFLARQEGLRHPHLLVGEDLGAGLGAPVQRVDGRQQLHRVGLGARLALLADEQLGDLVDVVEQRVGGAAHDSAARSSRLSSAQAGWMRATSSTTAWTWSGVIVATEPTSSPVAGLKDSSVDWAAGRLRGDLHGGDCRWCCGEPGAVSPVPIAAFGGEFGAASRLESLCGARFARHHRDIPRLPCGSANLSPGHTRRSGRPPVRKRRGVSPPAGFAGS